MSKNGDTSDDSPIKSGTNGSDAKKFNKGYDGIDWSVKTDEDRESKELEQGK